MKELNPQLLSLLRQENPNESQELLERLYEENPNLNYQLISIINSDQNDFNIRAAALFLLTRRWNQTPFEQVDEIIGVFLECAFNLIRSDNSIVVTTAARFIAILENADQNNTFIEQITDLVDDLYGNEETIGCALILVNELLTNSVDVATEHIIVAAKYIDSVFREHALRLAVSSLQTEFSLIEESFCPMIFEHFEDEGFGEDCLALSAEICAYVYLYTNNENCGTFVAACIASDCEKAFNSALLTLSEDEDKSIAPTNEIIDALIVRMQFPDEDPQLYGPCSISQTILENIARDYMEQIEEHITEVLSEVNDNALLMRVIYSVGQYMDFDQSVRDHILSSIESEFVDDALCALCAIGIRDESVKEEVFNIILQNVSSENESTMKTALFLIDKLYDHLDTIKQGQLDVLTVALMERQDEASRLSIMQSISWFIEKLPREEMGDNSVLYGAVKELIMTEGCEENPLLSSALYIMKCFCFVDDSIEVFPSVVYLIHSDDFRILDGAILLFNSLVSAYHESIPAEELIEPSHVLVDILTRDSLELKLRSWSALDMLMALYENIRDDIINVVCENALENFSAYAKELSLKIAQTLMKHIQFINDEIKLLLCQRCQLFISINPQSVESVVISNFMNSLA